jgi:predicted DNA-binding transcriptional regulator AlpA
VADLQLDKYQMPTTSMLQLVPLGEFQLGTVLGDPFLDRETLASFAEAVHAGFFTLNEDWGRKIADVDDAVLEQRFLERLRMTQLSGASPLLHHRRLALFEAIRDIGTEGSIPGLGLGPQNSTRAIGDIETWMEGKRQELRQRGFDDHLLQRMLTIVPSPAFAILVGLSEATLSRMRKENVGPRFVQLGSRRWGYPAIAAIEWLEERSKA